MRPACGSPTPFSLHAMRQAFVGSRCSCQLSSPPLGCHIAHPSADPPAPGHTGSPSYTTTLSLKRCTTRQRSEHRPHATARVRFACRATDTQAGPPVMRGGFFEFSRGAWPALPPRGQGRCRARGLHALLGAVSDSSPCFEKRCTFFDKENYLSLRVSRSSRISRLCPLTYVPSGPPNEAERAGPRPRK